MTKPDPAETHAAKARAEALVELAYTSGVAPQAAVAAARWCAGTWHEVAAGDVERVFDLASLTKPMLAAAVARSSLRIDAPLSDYLPELVGSPGGDAPIELLLAHRAGLEPNLELFAPVRDGRPFARESALEQAARALRSDLPSQLPRGGHPPIYSDLGYILVGEALARHEGARDAGEAIERLVIDHLGLAGELGTARSLADALADFDARVVPTEDIPWRGGVIRGIVHDENAMALTGRGGSGHAGIFGTVRGVVGFAAAVVDSLRASDRRHAPLGDLRWATRERPGGALRAGFDGKSPRGSSAGASMPSHAIGHLGFTGTSFWIDPDRLLVVGVLTNRVHPSRESDAIRAFRPHAHDTLVDIALSLGDAPG